MNELNQHKYHLHLHRSGSTTPGMHTSIYDEKIVQGITLGPHDDAYVPIWHTITEVSFDSQAAHLN